MEWVIAIVTLAVLAVISTLLAAYPVMLLLGMAHSTDVRVPAFGLLTTWLLTLVASVVVGSASRGSA